MWNFNRSIDFDWVRSETKPYRLENLGNRANQTFRYSELFLLETGLNGFQIGATWPNEFLCVGLKYHNTTAQQRSKKIVKMLSVVVKESVSDAY